jgi:hypothetical protein
MTTQRSPLAVPCPRCNAASGQPCRGPGRNKIIHGARVAASRKGESPAERERKLRVAREMFRP